MLLLGKLVQYGLLEGVFWNITGKNVLHRDVLFIYKYRAYSGYVMGKCYFAAASDLKFASKTYAHMYLK